MTPYTSPITIDETRTVLQLGQSLGCMLTATTDRVTAWHEAMTANLPGTPDATCPAPTYDEARLAVLTYARHDSGLMRPADLWRAVMNAREADAERLAAEWEQGERAEFARITADLNARPTPERTDPS